MEGFIVDLKTFLGLAVPNQSCPGVKITVGHQPKTKTDQISKIAAHFLVWSDIFQIKEDFFLHCGCHRVNIKLVLG